MTACSAPSSSSFLEPPNSHIRQNQKKKIFVFPTYFSYYPYRALWPSVAYRIAALIFAAIVECVCPSLSIHVSFRLPFWLKC